MNEMLIVYYAGVLLVALGLFFAILRLVRLHRCSSLATGTVASADPNDRQANPPLSVQVEIHGETYALADRTGGLQRLRLRAGDRVDIRYNPDNPADYLIDEDHRERKAAILCLLFGLVFIFAGGLLAGPYAHRLPFGRQFQYLRWWIRYRLLK